MERVERNPETHIRHQKGKVKNIFMVRLLLNFKRSLTVIPAKIGI